MEVIGGLAAAQHIAENLRAPRSSRLGILEHEGCSPFGHDETVAILGEGFRSPGRVLARSRERGKQREADDRFGLNRGVGAERQGGARLAAPDRLHAELDDGGPRGTSGRDGGGRPPRAELPGDMIGDEAVQEMFMGLVDELGRRSHRPIARRMSPGGEAPALRPFMLDRRARQEQGTRKIAGPAEAALRQRLARHASRCLQRETGRVLGFRLQEIDGAGEIGTQIIDGKTPDALDAGLPGAQTAPVLFAALAERGQDADARDRHRSGEFVSRHDHSASLARQGASSSTRPSPR
jgi:hypothetical protein